MRPASLAPALRRFGRTEPRGPSGAAQARPRKRRPGPRSVVKGGSGSRQQERVARAAQNFVIEHGEAPSVRELASVVGLSASTVAYHLRRMRDRGVNVETRGRPSGRCPYCGR
ncbi:hypothetical protein C3486_00275 [Streptomyces sp. Ru73]|uniref:LexA family protein n=1 Tax=Streptomyces sp. Ru73 TaxID=2080748 RepID=UPI000CDCE931|nr:hypothetical protein C3486_00275 [Streptomyces sp. Ru73]